jgi:hypothetical protein
MRLFRNPGNGNDWINVKLVGVKTNRAALGAKIKITVTDEGAKARSIYRSVGSGGSWGASPLAQHIGLGKEARIQSVEIYWPSSKTRQEFDNVKANQFIEIKEFAQSYTPVVRRQFRLGDSRKGIEKNAKRPAKKVPSLKEAE